MHIQRANLVRLSLSLLNHPDAEVRRGVYTLLHCAYGTGVSEELRRIAQEPKAEVRRQAQRALESGETAAPTVIAPQPPEVLHITCLGALRVYAAGRWIEARDWSPEDGGRAGWQKVQAVFSFLAHCGVHGTTRSALGEAVWGTAASPSSLARTLTTLRNVLACVTGPAFAERALLINGDYCRLDPALYESDAQIFERVFSLAAETEQAEGLRAAAPLYEQALELYGGPYLANIVPGNRWMIARRELLSSLYVLAAERLAAETYQRGDDHHCVQICLRALDAEPAADDLLTWMLQAYARLGWYGELDYSYRNYLQVTGLDPGHPHAVKDSVIETYAKLTRSRVVNE